MRKKMAGLMLGCQLFIAGSVHALLAPGAVAPDFTAEAALAGQAFTYTLFEALKKGPVVLYFYPKSFTSGCTVEAHLFAKALPDFSALGATVIGVSADTIDVQKEFSRKECSNVLSVVADPGGKVVRLYDVSLLLGSATSKRATYVITPQGKIFYAYANASPKEHIVKSLDAVRLWKSQQPPPVVQ